MGGRRLVRGPGRLGGMEHTSHSSRCLGGCRHRQGCQQPHHCRDRRRQNPRASAAAAAVAAAAREWLVGSAPVAAEAAAVGRSSSSAGEPQLLAGGCCTADASRAAGCAFVRVPCLRPSAASPRGADEAHRPRDARVRRGRRRLGGWWPPSGAAAFRVEKEFRVPPASVQRGGGAASSPLRFRPWRQRPERPESATTEER